MTKTTTIIKIADNAILLSNVISVLTTRGVTFLYQEPCKDEEYVDTIIAFERFEYISNIIHDAQSQSFQNFSRHELEDMQHCLRTAKEMVMNLTWPLNTIMNVANGN